MKNPGRHAILPGLIGAGLLVVLFLYWFGGAPNPVHSGKPVGRWFDDLCTGVWSGSPKGAPFDAAYLEFSRMDSDAVPYLVSRLRYDRSGILEKCLMLVRKTSFGRDLTADVVLPADRRTYAIVALRQMRTRAESAVPALLEAWRQDNAEVRLNAIFALETILFGKVTIHANPQESAKLESDVLAEVARRYPALAFATISPLRTNSP